MCNHQSDSSSKVLDPPKPLFYCSYSDMTVTALENEDVEAAYKSVVRGEERVKLIQEMIRRGVGFPGVEHFYRKQ